MWAESRDERSRPAREWIAGVLPGPARAVDAIDAIRLLLPQGMLHG